MEIVNTNMTNYYSGNMVTYKCINGFRIIGKSAIRCMANGKWSRMFGQCSSKTKHNISSIISHLSIWFSEKSCRKPIVSENTVVEGNSFLFQDKVVIQCPSKKKYTLECGSSEKWIGDRDDTC